MSHWIPISRWAFWYFIPKIRRLAQDARDRDMQVLAQELEDFAMRLSNQRRAFQRENVPCPD